ncbi:MAG TPA: ABC-2 family transporter protein [Bacillota bacterium]|nr:ABC-2 family transporter protein [Bacillota bacterium]
MFNFSLNWSLMRLEFMKMLAYRISYITGVVNYAVQIGAYFFLWQAIYTGRGRLGGLNKEEMLTYLIVAWIARSLYYNNLDRQISVEIKEGKVATDLIRPYDYQHARMARAMGEAVFRLFFFALPSTLVMYLLYPFYIPTSAATWGLFGLALLGAVLLNCQLNFMTGIVAFFTVNTIGVQRAKRVVIDLFSGLLLPISFYPDWARVVMKWLPFQTISYMPNLIYLGKLTGMQALQSLLLQVFWLVVLYALGRMIWRLALRKVAIQGG